MSDVELNDFVDDGETKKLGETPTRDDWSKLRRVADHIPTTAWYIVACELCERFTFYGVQGPMQNYIQFPPPQQAGGQPGAIGRGEQAATSINLFFLFFCYSTPLFGAVMADRYLGKYRTIVLFALIYLVGLVVLTVTSIPAAIAKGASLPGLIIAIMIIGLGTGGIKSNVGPMVADQYRPKHPYVKVLPSGERVIADPKLTVQTIFAWFYLAINIGGLAPIITTLIEKYHSFWLAYLIPTIMMVLGILIFISARKAYYKAPPSTSVIADSFSVMKVAFARGRNMENAKASNIPVNLRTKYRVTWDDNFVNDLKSALKACRVFLFYPIYWCCYNQMTNNLVSQAATMRTGLLPNDIMNNFDPLTLLFMIPLFEKVIYPFLRSKGLALRAVTRIFIGFLLSSVAMGYSAVLQRIIYNTGPCYNHPGCSDPNDISVYWQIPIYVIVAISEIFASITGLEYAYRKAPPSMRSLVTALFLTTSAFGSILGYAIVPLAVDPYLPYMYSLLAGIMVITACVFYGLFRKYDVQEELEEETTEKEIVQYS
ncbi:9984_t:CDS:2 [Paraglomus occultum]|uniref:9984_t:CDS:1 n=1 Tax=Paraglomus occultum TaxID=144539 RepID=A0A9N9FUY3_9GLOM|nr:9984_t:CDS:2 [Paraglomus occultum]